MAARKYNFRLSLFTILVADVVYFAWMPYPKSFLKTIWSSTFTFDIITNLLFFLCFSVILFISVKSIVNPGVRLGKGKICISIAAFCSVQLAFDIIKQLRFYPAMTLYFTGDLFNVIEAFVLVLLINKIAGTKNINYKRFLAISLPIAMTALVAAFALDIRTVHNLTSAADKYAIFSSELEFIKKNSDFLYSIRNCILDFISFFAVITALYFSSCPDKTETPAESRDDRGIFGVRVLCVIIASVFICVGKVSIIPHNFLSKTNISGLSSHPTRPVFFCNDTDFKIKRFFGYGDKNEKEVCFISHIKLRYDKTSVLSFYIDGETHGALLEKTDINGTEVAIVCDDMAIAYLKEGDPYAVKVSELDREDYDEILLKTCEKILKDGKLGSFEHICKYVLKYDPDFAMPYIERYIAGDFTDEELENNQSIRPEYISKCARRLAGE